MGPGTWPGHPAATNPFSFHPGNSAFKSPDAFKVSLPLRTNYLYGKIKKTLPELYAFTICLWLRSSASPGIGTPFSYAVPGQANEIVLIEWGNNPIELLINDKVRPAGVSLGPGEQTLEDIRTCWLSVAHRADPGQPQSVSATDWESGGCPPQHGGGGISSPECCPWDGGGRGYLQPMEIPALSLANNRQLRIPMSQERSGRSRKAGPHMQRQCLWLSLNALVEGTCVRV